MLTNNNFSLALDIGKFVLKGAFSQSERAVGLFVTPDKLAVTNSVAYGLDFNYKSDLSLYVEYVERKNVSNIPNEDDSYFFAGFKFSNLNF